MARKDDRRIQKTRKQLRESMLELILDRGYDDISIQDVTDRANLGRATFYLHYREKDELYADVIQNMAEDYFSSLPKQDPKKVQLFNVQHLKQLFNFVENHYDFYRIIIMGRGAMLTFVLLTDIAKNYILNIAKAQDPDFEKVTGIPADFLLNFNASTLMATIFWWLENNMPYSAEEMAKMYEKMSFYTNFQILRDTQIIDKATFEGMHKQVEAEMKAKLEHHGEDEVEEADRVDDVETDDEAEAVEDGVGAEAKDQKTKHKQPKAEEQEKEDPGA